MKSIKYFIQFLIIIIFFLIFKILGLKFASFFSGKIVSYIGPLFRSKELIKSNLLKALPNLDSSRLNKISKNMWNNYGRILAEYVFIKDFRNAKNQNHIEIKGQEILSQIKKIMNP